MQIMTRLRPLAAGGYRDREEEDNQRGYERDETDTDFHQLVRHLVVDGDDRASTAGRRARRTLPEMMPGYQRQPILRLTRVLPMRGAEEACGVCSNWTCTCPPWIPPTYQPGVHRAARNPEYPCGACGTWHAGSCSKASARGAAKSSVR